MTETTEQELTHYVKARKRGAKGWYFLTSKLGLNRLRIHAGMYTKEQAEQSAAEFAKQDESYEFKAVAM